MALQNMERSFYTMKRILAILLAALLLCCVFVACEEEEPTKRPSTTTTEQVTTEEPTTEEPTTEEETTDDGLPDLTDVYVDVWNTDSENHNPQPIDPKHKGVGVVLTIPEGGYLYEAAVQAPSYSDNFGTLKVKVFVWDTDFATTVAGEPLRVDEFVDFADNDTLVCEYDVNEIGAGKILILVCDGIDEVGQGVGVWTGKAFKASEMPEEYAKYGIESWINGKQNMKSIGKFSLVITEPEE